MVIGRDLRVLKGRFYGEAVDKISMKESNDIVRILGILIYLTSFDE